MENQLPEGGPAQPELLNQEDIKVESSPSEDAAKVDDVTPQIDMLQAARKEFNKNRKIVIKRVSNITVEVIMLSQYILFGKRSHTGFCSCKVIEVPVGKILLISTK